MGWAVTMFSGETVKERDNLSWNDIDIRLIEKLWIEGFEEYALSRNVLSNFVEFIQFKTACIGSNLSSLLRSRTLNTARL